MDIRPQQPGKDEARYRMLFPNCGCETEADCVPCNDCGSCIRDKDVCPCHTVKSEQGIGFEMRRETSGG